MAFCGSLISNHVHDQLYFDFDHECDGDGDGDGEFDGMVRHTREVTNDEDEAMQLLTEKVVEELVWYHMTRGKRDYLKNKNDVQYINPLGLFIPKRRRGSRDHTVFKSKKKRESKKNRYSYSIINSSSRSTEDKINAMRKEKKRRRNDMDNDDDKEEEGIKRSTKKKRKVEKVDLKKLGLDQLDFSDEIKSLIPWQEGTDKDFKLRITKRLFPTDMKAHHDRLSMPQNQIKDFQGFLNDEEDKELSKPKSQTNGIEVRLFDLASTGRTFGHDNDQNINNSSVETMRLRKWDMQNSSSYMLTTSWKSVLNKGVLRENDFVQIYSFRRNENLCFVLIKVVSDGQGFRDGACGSNNNTNQGNGVSGSSQVNINEDGAS